MIGGWCAASALVLACATPLPPLSFEESGLTPLPATPALHRQLTPLQGATEALLITIERDTGQRPAFDDEPVPDPADVAEALQDTRVGWVAARTAVAIEVLHALGGREIDARQLVRARAALIWDYAVEPRRLSEVDEGLVADALAGINRRLGIHEPIPTWDEEVSIFSADSVNTRLAWPVTPVAVTSRFGLRSDPFGEGVKRHLGLDLAATEGQLVRCAADGVVTFAGRRGGYGLHVEVRHADGYVTRYAHLSALHVTPGEQVRQGVVIGQAGHTGRATGPHLHFELWHHGVPMNPMALLSDAAPIAAR